MKKGIQFLLLNTIVFEFPISGCAHKRVRALMHILDFIMNRVNTFKQRLSKNYNDMASKGLQQIAIVYHVVSYVSEEICYSITMYI